MQKKSCSLKQIRVLRGQEAKLMLHSEKDKSCYGQQINDEGRKQKLRGCLPEIGGSTKASVFRLSRLERANIKTRNVELMKNSYRSILKAQNFIKMKQAQVLQCPFHQKQENNIDHFQNALEQFHKTQDQSKNYQIKIRCKQQTD